MAKKQQVPATKVNPAQVEAVRKVYDVIYLPHMERGKQWWRRQADGQWRPVAELVLKREYKSLFPKGNVTKYIADLKTDRFMPPAFVPPFVKPHLAPFDERCQPLPPPKVIRSLTEDINVVTQQVTPHDDDYVASAVVRLPYDPAAKAPLTEKFLAELVPNPVQGKVLLEFLGLCLVFERNRFKKFLCLVGDKNCGKSVLIEVFEHVIGFDNVSHLSVQQLGGKHCLIDTTGRLANFSQETTWPTRGECAILKAISGGDSLPCEPKGKPILSIIPSIRMLMVSNLLVQLIDEHIWTRVLIILCGPSIPEDQQDPDLRNKLKQEVVGIFAMLVQAAFDLFARGHFEIDAEMAAIVDGAIDRSNHLRTFCRECFESEPGKSLATADVMKAYKDFCSQGGYKAHHTIDRIKDQLLIEWKDWGIETSIRMTVQQKKLPAIRGLGLNSYVEGYAKILQQGIDARVAVNEAKDVRHDIQKMTLRAEQVAASIRAARKNNRNEKKRGKKHEQIDEIVEAIEQSEKARQRAMKAAKDVKAVSQEAFDTTEQAEKAGQRAKKAAKKAAVTAGEALENLKRTSDRVDRALENAPEKEMTAEDVKQLEDLEQLLGGDGDE